MVVDDMLRIGRLSLGAACTAAYDIPGHSSSRVASRTRSTPFLLFVPFSGQEEYPQQNALRFQGQTPLLEMMAEYDGIILRFFDPEHRHDFFLRFFYA